MIAGGGPGAVLPFGDTALVVEVSDVSEAHRVAATIEAVRDDGAAPGGGGEGSGGSGRGSGGSGGGSRSGIGSGGSRSSGGSGGSGIGDVVIGFRSVVVHLDPSVISPVDVEAWLTELAELGPAAARGSPAAHPRTVDIPVTFDGADLDHVAGAAGLPVKAVIDLVVDTELRVAFLGFAPGFPYLVGLPDMLGRIERRPTPRARVPAGSVAVGGGFAAVYPQSTPGGWMLIGRTGISLFDPDIPPYALLRAGDAVRFRRSTETPAAAGLEIVSPIREPVRPKGSRFAEVADPGLLTLVLDAGRESVAAIGVPRSGPADPDSMHLANRLAGNSDGAAGLEVTVRGPVLRFTDDVHVAVVAATPGGVDVAVDGHPAGSDAVLPVRRGQALAVGDVRDGVRAYVAVSGGFETPTVVGSRSSDMLSGLGLGPLVAGDRLDLGRPVRPHGLLTHAAPAIGRPGWPTLRVMSGPHRFPPAELARLTATPWTVGDVSNRVGLRLSAGGTAAPLVPPVRGVPSTGMVTGAIQVPPDGQPIVLMPDHATVGGYPVIACVIAADLGRLGQLGAGDRVYFEVVDRPAALALLAEHRRMLAGRVSGWFPTESGT